jgi:hypothetical protein
MNASVWVAIVSAIAGLLTAAFTYAVTKQREREADWRKLKLEMYREFTTAMAGMAEGDATDEIKRRFNVASNSLHLIASKSAVDALEAFRVEISAGNQNRSVETHDKLLSRLFWEIRRDLGEVPTEDPADFRMRLYTSGVKHK